MGALTALRDNILLWFIRVIQCLVSLTVTAVTIANVSDWHGMGCSIPDQLQVNFAAASVSFPVVMYLMLATGTGRVGFLPWNALLQLILDFTLLIVWVIPTSFPSYDCTTVCSNCNTSVNGLKHPATSKAAIGFYVWLGQLTCSCYMPSSDDGGHFKRPAVTIRRNAYLRPGKNDPATKIFRGVARIAVKQALDGFMIALLLASSVLTALAIYRKQTSLRRSSSLPVLFDVKDPIAVEKKRDLNVTVTSLPASPVSPSFELSSPTSAA